MKYKLQLLTAMFALMSVSLRAQLSSSIPTNVRAVNAIDGMKDGGVGNGEILFGIPMPPGELVGSEFLQDEWDNGVINTQDGKSFSNLKSRYNITKREIYFYAASGDIRVVPLNKISSIDWAKEGRFINATGFQEDGVRMDGLLHVLVNGSKPLYKKTDIVTVEPTYRKEFDMGNKNTRLVKKHTYFTAEGSRLIRLNTKSNKKFVATMGEEAADFLSRNKIKVSEEENLVALFDYLND